VRSSIYPYIFGREQFPVIKRIEECRVGGKSDLVSVLKLGDQELTGVFPETVDTSVTIGPLELVWSPSSGLLQIGHIYPPEEMYGENYGYRSGLNQSMVRHLATKITNLEKFVALKSGDTVLDIGSNDATSLKAYQTTGINRIGIDPTGSKFSQYYTDGIKLVPDFFTAENFDKVSQKRAKIITSIAMFYDLENPIAFARDIASSLAEDGIWHFEQSYMPAMLRLNSYDTICHEHVEYYSLSVVDKILKAAGLKLLDVTMNDINGASFAVTAAHESSPLAENRAVIEWLLEQEERMGLSTEVPYRAFAERVVKHREDLRRLLLGLKDEGKRVLGYGASTKGNVVLQYCGIGSDLVEAIAEVNPDKFGCFTPGTHIPIISEGDAQALRPDYYLVLPWHFRNSILQREQAYLAKGGKFIFPFPEIEIV
jgi:C-methyltransferase C-terminal domain/Putative zinc binding domain/Methyltransferase domain